MKQNDFHGFPESVKLFQSDGKVVKIKGKDGIVREQLEIHGTYFGRDGVFKFMKESDGIIKHRYFDPY